MTTQVDVLPSGSIEADSVAELLRAGGLQVGHDGAAAVDAVVLVAADPSTVVEALARYQGSARPVRFLLVVPRIEDGWAAWPSSLGEFEVISLQSTPAELVSAVTALAGGPSSIDADGPARTDPMEGLTDREGEIALLLVNGWGNEEIARSLEISQHTVRTHVQHILAKLGVHHRHALTRLVPNPTRVPPPRCATERAAAVATGGR